MRTPRTCAMHLSPPIPVIRWRSFIVFFKAIVSCVMIRGVDNRDAAMERVSVVVGPHRLRGHILLRGGFSRRGQMENVLY